jgi:hypothetical protein
MVMHQADDICSHQSYDPFLKGPPMPGTLLRASQALPHGHSRQSHFAEEAKRAVRLSVENL